jgi:hypothetical protein
VIQLAWSWSGGGAIVLEMIAMTMMELVHFQMFPKSRKEE